MLRKISFVVFLIGILVWTLTVPTKVPFLTLLAILIHESGHLLSAVLLGIKPNGVYADTFGIRLLFRGQILSYRKEILLCAAGPFFNLLSVGIGLLCGLPKDSFFLSVSTAFAILNLMPVQGFDGGRICFCLLAHFGNAAIACRITDFLSFLFLFALWSVSIYLILRTGNSLSLFFFSTAIFFRIFLQKNSP